MFKARVILSIVDLWPVAPSLESMAQAMGLHADAASRHADSSTWTWRADDGDAAAVAAMHATADEDLRCAYLEFFGHDRQAVIDAVSQAYAILPVRMPVELANEAAATWPDHPHRLQCAALAVTQETTAALSAAISDALRHADDEVWNRAAGAAALMPADEALRIIRSALETQERPERVNALKRLEQYLAGLTGDAS